MLENKKFYIKLTCRSELSFAPNISGLSLSINFNSIKKHFGIGLILLVHRSLILFQSKKNENKIICFSFTLFFDQLKKNMMEFFCHQEINKVQSYLPNFQLVFELIQQDMFELNIQIFNFQKKDNRKSNIQSESPRIVVLYKYCK